MSAPLVRIEPDGPVVVWTLARPDRKNAIDRATADALSAAVDAFEADDALRVAVLTGEGADFCAGADLKAILTGTPNRVEPDGDGPLGPTRRVVAKPTIAAIEGHAVAGGLELALWCDLRVASREAVLGVYCRRWGVPLIDGGTIRLPRLVGLSRALDLILTGRGVSAGEAEQMGLVNRVVPRGRALAEAVQLAQAIAAYPQTTLRHDRMSAYEQFDLSFVDALANELEHGIHSFGPEMLDGVRKFTGG